MSYRVSLGNLRPADELGQVGPFCVLLRTTENCYEGYLPPRSLCTGVHTCTVSRGAVAASKIRSVAGKPLSPFDHKNRRAWSIRVYENSRTKSGLGHITVGYEPLYTRFATTMNILCPQAALGMQLMGLAKLFIWGFPEAKSCADWALSVYAPQYASHSVGTIYVVVRSRKADISKANI